MDEFREPTERQLCARGLLTPDQTPRKSDMDVDTPSGSSKKDESKKRFEVKKVPLALFTACGCLTPNLQWNAVALWAWGWLLPL